MFGTQWRRLFGALVLASVCAIFFLASCTTPNFSFGDTGAAAPPHCQNLEQDEGESDVDCGGACAPCALSQRCNSAQDCRDGECTNGTCQAASCTDGSQGDTETDVDCGGGACKPCAAGRACAQGSDCQSGVCGEQGCAEPSCGDRVKNGSESDVDCGGPDCSSCIAGQGCVTPSDCVGSDCTSGKCALSCAAGLGNCDGDPANGCETNLRTDAEHCGDCAAACALSNAQASCAAGACRVQSCSAPFDDCNGDPADGCEVNTKTNVANCGACAAKPCSTLNGQAYCADFTCGISCDENFADCDAEAGNGCEKDVSRDINNCGGCGKKCTPSAGKTAWCRDGQCGETTCAAGRGDCNGDPDDDPAHGGCEIDLKADVDNCGECGTFCKITGGTAQCSAGECAIQACDPGLADCEDGYADGCETKTDTDAANCGKCGNGCAVAGGTSSCAGGMCQVKSCTAPFADCNGLVSDGCEVNTATNQTHCGACTGASANCNTLFDHAAAHCANSACSLDNCATDYLNCDTVPSNGCEVNSKTDKNHCGSCATACSSTGASGTTCASGTCAPTCTGTNISCGNPQNGCPIDKATDESNCGGCGKVCDSSAGAHVANNNCTGSACHPVCSALYADCDSNPGNGCERSVGTDKTNCGGCGVTCGTANASATSCSAGTCTPTCAAGFKNCGTPQQGCNVQLGTTSNCTTCGEACTGATPFCTASGCSGHLDIGVVGAGGSFQMGFQNSSVPVLTKNHVLSNAKGSSRVVLVGVTATEPYLSTEQVKYNGVTMTLALQSQTSEMHSYAGIFYLLDAALPDAAGTYPVSVTFTSSLFDGTGMFNVIELKNVAQVGTIVSSAATPVDTDCAVQGDRTVSLSLAQAGSFGYAVMAARTGTNATPNGGVVVQTMNLTQGNNPTPLVGAAGYALPINGNTSFTWNVLNCWNSTSVAIALKRVGN